MNTARIITLSGPLVGAGLLLALLAPSFAALGAALILAGSLAFCILAAIEIRRYDRVERVDRERRRLEAEREEQEFADDSLR